VLGDKRAFEAGALNPLDVTHIDMPATPGKVWRAIRATQAR
jgi:hypothetical protein